MLRRSLCEYMWRMPKEDRYRLEGMTTLDVDRGNIVLSLSLLEKRRISRTKTVIGTRNVSSVRCVKQRWSTNPSAAKMTNSTVVNVTINSLHRAATNAIKFSSQVINVACCRDPAIERGSHFFIGIRRHEETRISWTTISWTLLHVFVVLSTHRDEEFHSKRSEEFLRALLPRTFCDEVHALPQGRSQVDHSWEWLVHLSVPLGDRARRSHLQESTVVRFPSSCEWWMSDCLRRV